MLGIIAGAGRYPLLLIRELHRRQVPVVVVALEGISIAAISQEADLCRWLRVGQLRESARFLTQSGVSRALLAGGVPWRIVTTRPRPDWRAINTLLRGLAGDDQLLRRIAWAYDELGVTIVDPEGIAGQLYAEAGLISGPPLTDEAAQLVSPAWSAASKLGQRDQGQAAIAKSGRILLENRGGTDQLLMRARRSREPGGVLVKLAKPDQDRRFDLPAVGPATITGAHRAGLEAIVVRANSTLLIDREETTKLSRRLRVTLLSLDSPIDIPDHGSAKS